LYGNFCCHKKIPEKAEELKIIWALFLKMSAQCEEKFGKKTAMSANHQMTTFILYFCLPVWRLHSIILLQTVFKRQF